MKTRPEYREATEEGKPKNMMGRSFLGQMWASYSANKKNDPR